MVPVCLMALLLAAGALSAAAAADSFEAALKKATTQRLTGARSRLHGRRLQEVGLAQVLDTALTRNLAIRRMAAARRGAQASTEQAKAAFDPAISGSWSYTRTSGTTRGSYVTRDRGNTATIVESETSAEPTCITIDGQVVNFSDPTCTTSLIYGTEFELASQAYDKPPFSWTASLGADQYLPWGAQVIASVSTTLTHQSGYSVDGLYSALSESDPYGYGSRFPWTSSAALGLTSPLPYTKYFGDGFQPNYEIDVAKLSEGQAAWREKAMRIQVLQQVAIQYWGLVLARHQIEILTEHLGILQAMADRAQRRFDQKLLTGYALAQVKAAVEASRNSLEVAWAAYQTRSMALQTLLANDEPVVLVPVGYGDLLQARPPQPDHDEAVAVAQDRNPDIHISLEDLKITDAAARFRDAQTRPDVQLEVAYSVSQSSDTFGYDDPIQSLSNLVEPDQTDLYVGLRLRVPLGARAEQAALSRARAQQRQAVDTARLTRNRVVQLVEDSVRELRTTDGLVHETRKTYLNAGLAVEEAANLYEHEMVTQHDLLLRQGDLLTARLGLAAVLVRQRLAQVQLLAAQGVLEERLRQITRVESRR